MTDYPFTKSGIKNIGYLQQQITANVSLGTSIEYITLDAPSALVVRTTLPLTGPELANLTSYISSYTDTQQPPSTNNGGTDMADATIRSTGQRQDITIISAGGSTSLVKPFNQSTYNYELKGLTPANARVTTTAGTNDVVIGVDTSFNVQQNSTPIGSATTINIVSGITSSVGSSILNLSAIFGLGAQYAVAETQTSATLVTPNYFTHMTFTTTSLSAGNYIIQWTYNWNNLANNKRSLSRIVLDGNTASPLDSVAQTMVLIAGTENAQVSGFWVGALTAATHTIAIQYSNYAAGTTQMRRGRIYLYRIA